MHENLRKQMMTKHDALHEKRFLHGKRIPLCVHFMYLGFVFFSLWQKWIYELRRKQQYEQLTT